MICPYPSSSFFIIPLGSVRRCRPCPPANRSTQVPEGDRPNHRDTSKSQYIPGNSMLSGTAWLFLYLIIVGEMDSPHSTSCSTSFVQYLFLCVCVHALEKWLTGFAFTLRFSTMMAPCSYLSPIIARKGSRSRSPFFFPSSSFSSPPLQDV